MATILVSDIGECICRHIGPYGRGGGLQIDIEVVIIVIIITVTQKTWNTLFVICTIGTLLMEIQSFCSLIWKQQICGKSIAFFAVKTSKYRSHFCWKVSEI